MGQALDEDMVAMFISKLLDSPLRALRYKAERLIDPTKTSMERIDVFDELRMFVQEGHDSQAINLLNWLKPTNIEFPQPTVYATQISFELRYSATCLEAASTKDERQDCVGV